jgi:Ni/Fe-hydrogenase subunit HybB-like protein
MAAASDFNPFQAPPKGPNTFAQITDNVTRIMEAPKPPRAWYIAFAIALGMLTMFLGSITWAAWTGIGVWGNMMPVAWAFPIVNFVFWIGIGHAGTLISAILFLLRQNWRTAINRFAEAMTIFAVMCAGMFPLLHMGRPWLFFYLMPYPNPMWLWPQFRSPLVWDVFAVSTYFTVSLLFWFVGLIPDFATLRDRAKNKAGKIIYGMLSMGWRGSAVHWSRYETASLLLAGLATPLVVSVHTVVSFDFTIALVPGWHSTIFPPYFVAGAIYSGFAMVLTLAIPVRKYYNLEDLITARHLDIMAKVMLATGLIVAYGYAMEAFTAYYSGSPTERFMMNNRMFGPYGGAYWALIASNIAIPQLLWVKKIRRHIGALFVISLIVNLGMWLERFVIVVTSLARDFVPSAWGIYYPTRWDWATYIGTIGLFFTLFYLFLRFLPMISIVEVRSLVHETSEEGAHAD